MPRLRWLFCGLVVLAGCGDTFEFTSGGANGGGGSGTTTGNAGAGGGTGGGTSGGTGGTSTAGSGGTTGGNGGTGGVMCADLDGDGVTDCAGDCDDGDPSAYLGATEVCDGVDNDCDGNGDSGAPCNGIGTYVSGELGDDANPGTKAKPVKSIGQGILHAIQLGKTQPVFVAGTHYPEKVTLVEGVSLLGGYQCDQMNGCTWVRKPGQYDTAILDQDFEGVLAPAGITRATVVEGFRIQGKDGAPSAAGCCAEGIALTLNGGAPTITGNTINGGKIGGCNQYCGSLGVKVLGPPSDPKGALFEKNTISGGDSQYWCLAIDIGGQSVADVVDNFIKGGAGDWSRAITVGGGGSKARIEDNDIFAGTCKGGNGSSFGVGLYNGTAIVDKNRINVGPNPATCASNNWSGGLEGGPGNETITNNVILGMNATRSTAVSFREGEVPIGTVVMNGNTLDGAGMGAMASAALQLGPLVQGNNGFVGTIRNNILLGGAGNMRFGVFEENAAGKTLHPQAFAYNDLFDFDVVYRFWDGATATMLSLAEVNVQVGTKNFSSDPMIDATYHLGSPAQNACVDAGTATEAPPDDMDGDMRPQGNAIDVGADEAL